MTEFDEIIDRKGIASSHGRSARVTPVRDDLGIVRMSRRPAAGWVRWEGDSVTNSMKTERDAGMIVVYGVIIVLAIACALGLNHELNDPLHILECGAEKGEHGCQS